MPRVWFPSLLLAATLAQAASPYHVLSRYPVPGVGGWDYITLDSAARRLYVSHGTVVDVLNADTGEIVGQIADTPGVHGIALVPEAGRGFTTNGGEHMVSLFDMATLKLIRKIEVGKGPDGIFYEPGTKRIFTCNHGSHDLTVLDAVSGNVVGTVAAGGDGEQMVMGRNGLLYVNLEDTAEVIAIDPKTLAIRHRFPIGTAAVATGLGYDPKTNRLFVMCRKEPRMVVMDAESGKVVATLPIGAGVDWGYFDAATKQVFASCGDGTLHIFRQKSADEYEEVGPVQTQLNAKTMAFDPKTGKIFLSAGEFEAPRPAEPGKRPQRTVKAGSFGVLVVGK